MPSLTKVLTVADYEKSIFQLSQQYATGDSFHQATFETAREFPRALLRSLGLIARQAIPESENRPDRLKVCRALGLGAAAGAMMAADAHDIKEPFSDWVMFESQKTGLPPREFIAHMHENVPVFLQEMIGVSPVRWLDAQARDAAEMEIVDAEFRSWYPIGASQTISLLHVRAQADTSQER